MSGSPAAALAGERNSAGFWMGLQGQYDLEIVEERLGERLNRVVVYSVIV